MGRVADPQGQAQDRSAHAFEADRAVQQASQHRRADYTIIIPVFNGETRIAATLEAVTAHFAGHPGCDVVVVDDGSRDETASVVEAWAARDPRVRLIRLPRNRGKGAAVRAGILANPSAYCCFFDGDLPMPAAEIDTVLTRLERGAPVVIASRALPDSRAVVQPDAARRLMSGAFNRLVRALFRLPFRDTQCGLKGFSGEAARAIFSRSRLNGFAFDVELLLLARQLGYRVEEVPVRVDNPAPSTVRIAAHAPQITGDLWRLFRRFR